MGTLAGVGISHHRHPVKAAQAAVDQALNAAGITQPDYVWLFASLGYDPEKLSQTVRAATGNAPLIGCSGQGVIVQGEGDESSFTVSVMVIQSDELQFNNHWVDHQDDTFEQIGRHLGQQLAATIAADPIALFLFTDGLTLNFDRLAAGLQSTLPLTKTLPIFGGAAGSDYAMHTTYQFCDDQVLNHGTVVSLMSGQGQIAWSLNHGCQPIGTTYTITKAEANVIYELDHQPALNILRQYLTEEEMKQWSGTVLSFCFGLQGVGREEMAIRYLPRKDEATGAVMLQTEVCEGDQIWLMRRDQAAMIQGTESLAADLNRQLNGQVPKLILQFDCYGRGKSVFTKQQKDTVLQQLQQNIGPTLPWIGFYSHGEIAPIGPDNAFHNYTLVLTAVY